MRTARSAAVSMGVRSVAWLLSGLGSGVSLVTTAVLTRIPQEELYTLAWGQAAWLPCPCPRLPGCPAVCGERRFQQKGRQGIGEHRMDCGIGAQIGQGKGVNQGLPVEHRIGCPRFG